MDRRIAALVNVMGLLVLVLLMGGCQAPAAPPDTSTTEPLTIGLSISTLNNPFFVAMQKGALEASDRLGVELIIQNAQNHTGRQSDQLAELIARKVDALLINPVDGEAIAAQVVQANEAGIPVITLDSSVPEADVLTHIASDNVSGGRMAAAYVVDLIGEVGNVVELQGVPDTSVAHDRGQAFEEMLAKYPDVQIVDSAVANFDRWQAKKAFEQILVEHGAIDAVFAHNDQMILGAIEAAEEAGRAKDMIFIGFDGTSDAVVAIEQGELTATVAQQPAEMGRLGVELAVDHLREGESIPEFTLVDLALIAQ